MDIYDKNRWKVFYHINGMYQILGIDIYPPEVKINGNNCATYSTYKDVWLALLTNYQIGAIERNCKIYVNDLDDWYEIYLKDFKKLFPEEFI